MTSYDNDELEINKKEQRNDISKAIDEHGLK